MKNNMKVLAESKITLFIHNDIYRDISTFSLIKLDDDIVLYIDDVPKVRYEVKKVFNIAIDGDVKAIVIESDTKNSLTCHSVRGNITLSSGVVNCQDVNGNIEVNTSTINCMDIKGTVVANDCKINAMKISTLTKN